MARNCFARMRSRRAARSPAHHILSAASSPCRRHARASGPGRLDAGWLRPGCPRSDAPARQRGGAPDRSRADVPPCGGTGGPPDLSSPPLSEGRRTPSSAALSPAPKAVSSSRSSCTFSGTVEAPASLSRRVAAPTLASRGPPPSGSASRPPVTSASRRAADSKRRHVRFCAATTERLSGTGSHSVPWSLASVSRQTAVRTSSKNTSSCCRNSSSTADLEPGEIRPHGADEAPAPAVPAACSAACWRRAPRGDVRAGRTSRRRRRSVGKAPAKLESSWASSRRGRHA
mmetsp:Transcript_11648/g.37200  ORF Transcript_11648/g.37200 Transcript_11648/m.37200 type:complete len:287 (-) Transcript_11648:76-936(-)